MFLFFFNDKVQVKLGATPNEADVAIVPINSRGTVGELNKFVLYEYGYDESIFKQLSLGKGFDLFKLNGKTILFIVTVGSGNPINNLNDNLRQAITTHFDFLSDKKIWIPLMATGYGKISYLDSYKTTLSILEDLKSYIIKLNCQFIIAIPDDEKGKALYKQIEDKGIDSTINNDPKEVNKVIEQLNAKYYFVGIDWEGNNQTERFYKQGIWETGYEDRFSGIIKDILVNDVLIIKEPQTIDGKSFYKIIAIGKVIGNPKDGTRVNVNWIIKNLSFEIKTLGYNSSTITPAHLDSVKEIFSKINSKDLQNLKTLPLVRKRGSKSENTETVISNKPYTTTLPGILGDSETGEDHLEIKKDVEAFARVIGAKSFTPPLAIALLGKWGSGKSFFMQKLKEDIQKLSESNPQEAFCEGIVHVHFNAWSYTDANLWASIVTRIFEGLQEYISGDTKAKNFKKEIEKKLTQNLNFSKDEILFLEKQNKIINIQLFGLYRQQINSKRELKKKISTIKQNTLGKILKNVNEKFKVKSTIEQSLNENPTFIKSTEDLANIVPEKYWISPDELFNQVQSKYTFLKVFFKKDKWLINTIWLIGILLIIYLTPIFNFIVSLLASWQDFSFTAKTLSFIILIGNFWKRAVDTYNKLQPLIASFWKIKENYETEKADALFKFKQREKALSIEIINSKEEIKIIDKQINHAKEIKDKIKFKLDNALSTEALFTFIEKRANSEDYKKHLGIVSIIRKDFEVLSDLLTDHNIEAIKNKESEEFKEMFDKPLERIILYIDDLDRCPEERVVEVLEAVNLLMAFPLFVVVVGVDPRWVKNALIRKHQMQFTGYIDKTENKELEVIEASSYLDKIFQVPFHLKDADDTSIKNMIEKLAKTKIDLIIDTLPKTEFYEEEKENIKVLTSDNNNITADNAEISSEIKISDLLNEEEINALDITADEIEQIKSLTEVIGNNPRCIKRFINIYRIIKTHEDFNYEEETKENELLIVMFFIALSIGKFNFLLKSFEYFLENIIDKKLSLIEYFETSYKFEIPDLLIYEKDKLHKILLSNNNSLLKQNVTLSRRHYQFIKRFTFKNI